MIPRSCRRGQGRSRGNCSVWRHELDELDRVKVGLRVKAPKEAAGAKEPGERQAQRSPKGWVFDLFEGLVDAPEESGVGPEPEVAPELALAVVATGHVGSRREEAGQKPPPGAEAEGPEAQGQNQEAQEGERRENPEPGPEEPLEVKEAREAEAGSEAGLCEVGPPDAPLPSHEPEAEPKGQRRKPQPPEPPLFYGKKKPEPCQDEGRVLPEEGEARRESPEGGPVLPLVGRQKPYAEGKNQGFYVRVPEVEAQVGGR